MAHSLCQICRIFPLDQTEFCSQVSEIISSVNVSNRLCKDGLLIITQLVWILILPTPFRFENMWLLHPEFRNCLLHCGKSGRRLVGKDISLQGN